MYSNCDSCDIPFIAQALSDFSTVFLLVDSPGFKVLVNRALLYLELGDWSNGLLDFIMAGKVCSFDIV